MKYDENILRYLMMNYDGKVTELRKLWKSAVDLELETRLIMERILRQTEYTGVMVQDRDEILISYAHCEEHDAALVKKILMDMAYDYFVCEAIVCPEIFDMVYQKYAKGELTDRRCSLALLKFWAENRQGMEIPDDTVRQLIQELLKEEIYFPFYVRFVDMVPELHYIKDSIFIEYRTQPQSQVYIHYAFDDDAADGEHTDSTADRTDYGRYDIKAMQEMYAGIYVGMFQLFHGETLQYYITENFFEEGKAPQERVTQSGTLAGKTEETAEGGALPDRFNILNDIMISISLQDGATAQQLTEDYLYQDFCVRELFRVL